MKSLSTIRHLFPLFFLMAAIIGCSPSSDKQKQAENVVDSIGRHFVPDERMGLFDIMIRPSGGTCMVITGTTTSSGAAKAVINTLSKFYNELIDSIIILPDTSGLNPSRGLATLSVINMRKEPDHGAEMVSQALLGTPLRILKERDGWYLVQTPDNYLGWTEKSSVVPFDAVAMEKWRNAARVIYTDNYGLVFTSSGHDEIMSDIVCGSILVKEGEDRAWTEIMFPDGRKGWVSSSSVTYFGKWRNEVKCTGEGIVKWASRFTGLPYLWGGSSAKAVDCSGLSKIVYFMNGIILFRDASQQALHGLNIDISSGYGQLRPGDLLFFGRSSNNGPHVTHVAIYEGQDDYINATGRVLVNSLDSAKTNYSRYRKNSLLSARRVIGTENDPGIMPVRLHPWY
jgi:hypothetical protein